MEISGEKGLNIGKQCANKKPCIKQGFSRLSILFYAVLCNRTCYFFPCIARTDRFAFSGRLAASVEL